MKMVQNLNPSGQQLAEGSDNALFVQIAFWVIVSPYHQDSSMMPSAHDEQIVQIFKVVVIVRKKRPIVADRVG